MKLIFSFLVLIILISCLNEPFYNKKDVYKGIETWSDPYGEMKQVELYLCFLGDSTIAINYDSLKECAWEFVDVFNDGVGLYYTENHDLDTSRIIYKNNYIEWDIIDTTIKFSNLNFEEKKLNEIYNGIFLVKKAYDNGLRFSCFFTLREALSFYDKAIAEIKYNLKQPNSARFNKVHVDLAKYFDSDINYATDSNVIEVSIELEAKNGFGIYGEEEYYVFFTEYEDNPGVYRTELSEESYNMKKHNERWDSFMR